MKIVRWKKILEMFSGIFGLSEVPQKLTYFLTQTDKQIDKKDTKVSYIKRGKN